MNQHGRMKACRIDDPGAFLTLTEGLRDANPLTTNVLGSVATALAEGRYDVGGCWVVEDASGTVGAALRTPPHKLVLSPMPSAAVPPLMALIDIDDPDWSGLLATPDVAEQVLAASAKTMERGMREWILVLDTLIPATAPGKPMPSVEADTALLMDWLRAFAEEAGVEFVAREEQIRAKAAAGDYTFWSIDGVHVGLASHAPIVRTRSHAIGRIGPVYTLPGYRRQGIGAAVTSVVADALVAEGCTRVMLHTDASNPTSNGVYERIGFVRVTQVEEWKAV